MQFDIDNFHPSLVFAHIVQSKFQSHTDEVSGHQNNQNTSSVQLFVTYDEYETDPCASLALQGPPDLCATVCNYESDLCATNWPPSC